MIYRYIIMPTGKQKKIQPTPKQNKYLLTLCCEENGRNWNCYGYADKVRKYTLSSYQIYK